MKIDRLLPEHDCKKVRTFEGTKARRRALHYERGNELLKNNRIIVTMCREAGGKYYSALFCFDKSDKVTPMLVEWEYENKSKREKAKPVINLFAELITDLFNFANFNPSVN